MLYASVFRFWELLDSWPVVGRLPEAWGICECGILLTRSRSFLPNHVWDGMLMMCMFLLWLLYFSVYIIARFKLSGSTIFESWSVYCDLSCYFLVARWGPMDVMFYHMMLFSYSWRTDVIMMIIFMVPFSCLCRIEMMLSWFCDLVISCLG